MGAYDDQKRQEFEFSLSFDQELLITRFVNIVALPNSFESAQVFVRISNSSRFVWVTNLMLSYVLLSALSELNTASNFFSSYLCAITPPPGGTPLYKLYRYLLRQRVLWFLSLFGLK